MDTIPAWRLSGDWFDVCSCDIPCPCTFAQAPTNNACQGVLAYKIRDGELGDVALGGLNLVALGTFEGNVWDGETKVALGLFIDERADERQRQALLTILGGQAGGWPASFAEVVGEVRGVEYVPITIDVAGDLASWRVAIPQRVEAGAEALSGPTTPPGQRVQTINPPGSEVGPGQVATWGRGTASWSEGFGMRWRGVGTSSKHIPFDWSGPDAF
jgi:hypothetical protein